PSLDTRTADRRCIWSIETVTGKDDDLDGFERLRRPPVGSEGIQGRLGELASYPKVPVQAKLAGHRRPRAAVEPVEGTRVRRLDPHRFGLRQEEIVGRRRVEPA